MQYTSKGMDTNDFDNYRNIYFTIVFKSSMYQINEKNPHKRNVVDIVNTDIKIKI